MKTLLILLSCVLIIGCETTPRTYNWKEHIPEKCELRRLNFEKSTSTSWSASYFVFMGSAGGSSKTKSEVLFSWKNSNDEYVLSKVPIHKVRVRFDSTIVTPYISFDIDYHHPHKTQGTNIRFNENPQLYIEWDVNYIVITCKEEDYQEKININQLP